MNPLFDPKNSLNEREKALLETAIQFCKKEVAPNATEWDKAENLPRDIFAKAGKLGLMGLTAPRALGGQEVSCVAYSMIIHEIAKSFAALAMDVAAHNALAIGHILKAGNDEQKKKYIPKLASGEWVGAWALTEPNAGSDSGGMETVGTLEGNQWILNGGKKFITEGSKGDVYVVIAQTGTNDKGKKEITSFVTTKDQVKPIRKIHTFGMKASDTAELKFINAKAELLGEKGHGQEYALAMLERGRIGIASMAVGIGRAAYEAAVHYSLERKQFGKAIAEFEAIQWMIADSAMELDAAELLVMRAAYMQDQGMKTPKESAMAKLFAGETASRVCNRSMQIHGGNGYSCDYPVERYLRDAKLCEIGEGTSEIQRIVISKNILKASS
jgi:alkylation response protein AidB-like acyl-CoA dehydrogenase